MGYARETALCAVGSGNYFKYIKKMRIDYSLRADPNHETLHYDLHWTMEGFFQNGHFIAFTNTEKYAKNSFIKKHEIIKLGHREIGTLRKLSKS